MGEWSYGSNIFDLGTRWEWVISFTSRPHYRRVNHFLFPLDRRLGGPQIRSGRCEEEENFAPTWNQILVPQPVTRGYVDWAIPNPLFAKKKSLLKFL
jgi:hypothetical protein